MTKYEWPKIRGIIWQYKDSGRWYSKLEISNPGTVSYFQTLETGLSKEYWEDRFKAANIPYIID